MDEFTLNGIRCTHIQTGSGGPLFLIGSFRWEEDPVPHLRDCILALTGDAPLHLLIFEVDDWNRAFSPWTSGISFRGQTFPGGGPETLRWIRDRLLPELFRRYDTDGRVYLTGYSLAGLFSLWALYEEDCFAGCACCSGSLWYEGFGDYAASHGLKSPANVYLSLGGKEADGKDPVTGRVGIETKAAERRLKADPNARHVTYVLNSGGHFADSGKRLAKGILWLLSQN